jgi:hypothetical protein
LRNAAQGPPSDPEADSVSLHTTLTALSVTA